MNSPASGTAAPWRHAVSWLTAGLLAVLVGFSSSVAIVFEAARQAGATSAEIGSWVLALGIGMGLTCIVLSIVYRMPIMTAWSTPGAALLASSLAGVPMSAAMGAFIFSGALIAASGFSGWFEKVIDRVPLALAAALLAGVLARFGLDVVTSMKADPVLVGAMVVAYLAGRRLWPKLAVLGVLLIGMAVAAAQGRIETASLALEVARPVWTTPTFDPAVLLGVGLPLFIITMASQNVPGVAVLKASGYPDPPVSSVVGWTGLATVVLAPFGGFSFNFAAITAALCAGPQAHEDPARRWLASVAAGVFYLLTGLFGSSIALVLAALPHELVAAVAGLALLATIASGLATATADPRWREPAIIVFLVTLSGVSFLSISSAFWGLIAGVAAGLVLRR